MSATITTVGSMLERYRTGLAGLYDVHEAKAIARSVFRESFGWDMAQLEERRPEQMDELEFETLSRTLDRLVSGEPLQYILGHTWFMGLRIHTASGVLIPRPETEEMVDRIANAGPTFKCIADLGTGSGCIAIALKKAFPAASVMGIDISLEALRIAERNAVENMIEVDWRHEDILRSTSELCDGCDLIVSNPPYIPRSEAQELDPHVRAHEPDIALFVENDDPLVFYRAITVKAKDALNKGGQLWFECHFNYASQVADLVRAHGFESVELVQDMSGNPRFIQAIR